MARRNGAVTIAVARRMARQNGAATIAVALIDKRRGRAIMAAGAICSKEWIDGQTDAASRNDIEKGE